MRTGFGCEWLTGPSVEAPVASVKPRPLAEGCWERDRRRQVTGSPRPAHCGGIAVRRRHGVGTAPQPRLHERRSRRRGRRARGDRR